MSSRLAHALRHTSLIGAALLYTALPAAAEDLRSLLNAIDATTLQPERAVRVERLEVDANAVRLQIRSGTLYPARPVAGAVTEMVFIGDAVVHMTPPDDIEAGQLEFFTGARVLEEPITEAVLVVCKDEAARVLLARESAGEASAEDRERAERLFARWIEGTEREILGVRAALLRDALGDPRAATYFAGRFTSERLGTFLALLDPDAEEQLSIGQFVRVPGTEKERRKGERFIRRQQRRGRLLGLSLDDLGDWDQWVQSALRDDEGKPATALQAFEPVHYDLDVHVHDDGEGVGGLARIRLEAVSGQRRFVTLNAGSDVRVSRVTDADGNELAFTQDREDTHVVLPSAPAAATTVEIDVHFDGRMIAKLDSQLYLLRDTISWYPHAGRRDRATYDVRIDWPIHLDLVAAGGLVEEGQREQRYWQRRKIDLPVIGFSFEVGRYKLREFEAGHVKIKLALDRLAARGPAEPVLQFEAAIADALSYFEKVFGPYPLDYLTVVTAPRDYGQGLLGFVTLPSKLAFDPRRGADLENVAGARTAFVAHEIAHQWWGNVIGWKSYHDQWLSEAMADYASLLWARDRLPPEARGPGGAAADWQAKLNATAADGRPLEAVGPLVLGLRLSSSKAEAYAPIVYSKGAVVLGMLSQVFGEDAFLEAQRILLDRGKFREISTEGYVQAMERMSGTDLGWFARQYIYGTGVPEARYSYAFEEDGADGWLIQVSVKQDASGRRTCGAVSLDDGTLDVRCRSAEAADGPGNVVVVPFQLGVHDPASATAASSGKKRKKKRTQPDEDIDVFNILLSGRHLLEGGASEFTLPSQFEPRRFWLDREGVVFGKFIDMTRPDRPGLVALASEARDAGDAAQAVELLRRAMAIDSERDAFPLWAALASTHLDLGQVVEARRALSEAEKDANRSLSFWLGESLRAIKARLAVLEGKPERALRHLEVRSASDLAWVEGWAAELSVLLAIAAKGAREDEVLAHALEMARARGADVSALE